MIDQPAKTKNACKFQSGRAIANLRRLLRVCGGESGTTIVEFAISTSVLFMLAFGIIQTCLALYAYEYVSDAAASAARYAAVRGGSCTGLSTCGATSAQIQTYVQSIAYPGIRASSLAATATWLSASPTLPTTWTACGNQCDATGNAVNVQVTYTIPLFIPYWRSASISVSSASQMVIVN